MAASRQSPPRRSVPRVLAVLAIAMLAGVLIGVLVDVARAGGPRTWLALRGLAVSYASGGTTIRVDGRDLHLDCRGAGTPTVVFESGMGDGAGAWRSVHDEIASTTRACAYDRAGRGASEAAGRRTLADAATELRRLLELAGEPGPFVMVGHSLGGDYARVFVDAHRGEVAGLVLVDAFTPDLEQAAIHPLLGPLRAGYAARLDGLRALVADVEDLDWPTSEAQLRSADLRGVPIEVLRAPRADPRLDAATNEAIEAAVVEAFEALSPGLVRYELAWGAGHIIQVDRPDLVVAAVGRLVEGGQP